MADPCFYQIAHYNMPGGCLFEPQVGFDVLKPGGIIAISATNLQGVYLSPGGARGLDTDSQAFRAAGHGRQFHLHLPLFLKPIKLGQRKLKLPSSSKNGINAPSIKRPDVKCGCAPKGKNPGNRR